jgi:ceramide synthetase
MEFFVHHLVTVTLMVLSWSYNLVRIGTLVLCLHDQVDYLVSVS